MDEAEIAAILTSQCQEYVQMLTTFNEKMAEKK